MAELNALSAGAVHQTSWVRSRRESRYYVGIAIVLLAIILVGFTRSFYLRPFFTFHHSLDLSGSARMPVLVILHGMVLTAWFLLFFGQVWLAATRRVHVHRQLGIAAAVTAAVLVVVTAPTIILAIPRLEHAHIPAEIIATLVAGDALSLVWFALFVGLALYLRRRSDTHKRLMVLACVAILVPALARLGDMLGQPTLVIVGGSVALCLSLVIYDLASRKRLHAVTLWGGLLLVVANPLLMALLIALNEKYAFVAALGRLAE